MCVPPNGFDRVSIFLLPQCRAKRPLLLPFPAERKRKGPRGLSADQFLLPLTGCSPDSVRGSQSYYFHCAAGFADATSFSLLDAKRTKQEKHAWGSIPHAPPRTALRQRAVERHVKTCSAKRLQTHRLTAVQTGSLFVSPLREEIPSRATPPVWRNAALAYHYLTAAQWLSGYERLQKPCVARR